jgi:hypothetical protein
MAKESSITAATDDFDPATIIAGLCAKASNEKCNEARDVLRRYNHSQTYNQNRTAISSNFNKAPLLQTAKFLRIQCDDLRKDELVHEIICQVQNLLPDECQICNEAYKSNLGDIPYLSCDVCGQEAHKPCIMKLLGIDEGTQPNINPSNLPGIHYICKACEEDVSKQLGIKFPDHRNGKKETAKGGKAKKQKQTALPQSDNPQIKDGMSFSQAVTGSPTNQQTASSECEIVEIIHCSQTPCTSSGVPDSPLGEEATPTLDSTSKVPPISLLADTPKSADSQSQNENENASKKENPLGDTTLPKSHKGKLVVKDNDNPSQKEDPLAQNASKSKTKICRFYAKNTCKFGAKGTKCPFKHPDRCQKLLNHGTKQPNGCNKSKSCPDFHPKMCTTSITKRQCFAKDCHLTHVKGTIRNPSKESQPSQNKPPAAQIESASNKKPAEKVPATTVTAPMQEKKYSQSTDGQQNSFLELARLIKEELMEAMDKKIAMAFSQIPQQQMPATYYPPPIPQFYQQPPYQHPPQPNHPLYQQWQQTLQAMTQSRQMPVVPQSQTVTSC